MTRTGWWLLLVEGLLFIAVAGLMLTAVDRALDASPIVRSVDSHVVVKPRVPGHPGDSARVTGLSRQSLADPAPEIVSKRTVRDS